MDAERFAEAVDELVRAERARCLWFVRPDYLPRTDEERRWVLAEIRKRADRATFTRATELERWLSHPSSAPSADS